MIAIYIIISFALGVLLGAKVYKTMVENELKKENEKLVTNINSQYSQLLDNITTGFSRFKSRVNSTVHIESTLNDHGNIDIIYLLDKNDVAIFQGNKCLYTSDKADKHVISDITKAINHLYKKEITEVIDFFGLVLSKQEFEKQFSFDPNEILKLVKNSTNQDISEMDKIIDENQLKFDVDEILDKISNYGIDVLTPEERKFLDNFGEEKNN
jgi:hypothetical protein